MTSRCKFFSLLTPAQSELLKTLFELHEQIGPDRYWRPRDLGAYRSSHHALTLKRLQGMGLVERAPLPETESHRNFGYRITNMGVETWDLLLDASRTPLHSIFAGPGVQERARTLVQLAA